jgi:uncharacterized protein
MRRANFFDSATAKIILINVVVYVLFIVGSLFVGLDRMLSYFALQPESIIHGEKLWTLITSMFIHVQVWHLFVNMFSLFFVGRFVEKIIGKKRFSVFYVLSGIFAGLFWAFLSGYFAVTPMLSSVLGSPTIWGIGASGAIFGLVGILAVLAPRAKVFLIAGPLIVILLETLLVAVFNKKGIADVAPYSSLLSLLSIGVMIYFAVAIFSMMSFDAKTRRIGLPLEMSMWVLPIVAIVPLVIISIFVDLPIGNMAHLGGLIAGLIYASILKKKYPRRSRMISRMFK